MQNAEKKAGVVSPAIHKGSLMANTMGSGTLFTSPKVGSQSMLDKVGKTSLGSTSELKAKAEPPLAKAESPLAKAIEVLDTKPKISPTMSPESINISPTKSESNSPNKPESNASSKTHGMIEKYQKLSLDSESNAENQCLKVKTINFSEKRKSWKNWKGNWSKNLVK
jgi:hypothetical protein